MEEDKYVVFIFPSVSYALKAERLLKDRGIAHKLIPVPRHISSDCGVCLRIMADQQDAVTEVLQGQVAWEDMVPL